MADKVGKSSVAKKLIKDQRVLLAIVIAIIIVVVLSSTRTSSVSATSWQSFSKFVCWAFSPWP